MVSTNEPLKALPRTGVDASTSLWLAGALLLLGGALVAGTRKRRRPGTQGE